MFRKINAELDDDCVFVEETILKDALYDFLKNCLNFLLLLFKLFIV